MDNTDDNGNIAKPFTCPRCGESAVCLWKHGAFSDGCGKHACDACETKDAQKMFAQRRVEFGRALLAGRVGDRNEIDWCRTGAGRDDRPEFKAAVEEYVQKGGLVQAEKLWEMVKSSPLKNIGDGVSFMLTAERAFSRAKEDRNSVTEVALRARMAVGMLRDVGWSKVDHGGYDDGLGGWPGARD